MKITSFNPLIVTKDAAPVIKLFEELGFERRHSLDANTGKVPLTNVRMKRMKDGSDTEAFYVDISEIPDGGLDRDLTLIRMNVDDFDEAYNWLIGKGFKNKQGDHVVETKSNKSAGMISPSGFMFDLCQHIKDHD